MSTDSRAPVTHVIAARANEWADPTPAEIDDLLGASEQSDWRAALGAIEPEHPFFAKRMRNLGLANWHVLLLSDSHGSALDVGCGFGSLALGLGDYFRFAVGIDALRRRVRYGALRARQDHRDGNGFVQGSGLGLPFRGGSFDLVTLNGVLEWAGYHAEGRPTELQRTMLVEAQRVLKEKGSLAVAIENRFAMETLMGMHDTHTGVRLVPALPRAVADLVMRWRKHRPFRTYLYSRSGYQRLMRSAGFQKTAVFDLVSSYNDYDFVVTPGDTATYQLLWKQNLVRTFYRRAGSARRAVARIVPRLLGETGYAFLVLGGASVQTALDAQHPLWAAAAERGVQPGVYRFACNAPGSGGMTVLMHDGTRVTGLLSLTGCRASSADDVATLLPSLVSRVISVNPTPRATWALNGITVRAFEVNQG